MPELPEVETIARELRPLVSGRRIVSAWTDWPRVVRHPPAGRFLEAVLHHRLLGVGRRAKWVLLDLDGDLVLPVQLKMTGQLDVVPGERRRDRHVHLALGLDDGRELRLRDVRKFARVGRPRNRSPSSARTSESRSVVADPPPADATAFASTALACVTCQASRTRVASSVPQPTLSQSRLGTFQP